MHSALQTFVPAGLSLGLVLSLAGPGCGGTQKPCPAGGIMAAKAAAGNATKVHLFAMSQCPHSADAEKGLAGALRALGDRVTVNIDFIATEKDGAFKSLHGPSEVQGDIVQLCVARRYPSAKTLGFIGCMNKQAELIPSNWKGCARAEGIDIATISSCTQGKEGKKLLRTSLARAKKAGYRGSPTILIDGKLYKGGRAPSDFVRAICKNLKGHPPVACRQLPEPVAVTLIVITDKRCGKACDTREVELGLTTRYLPKLTVKRLDYGSEAGRALFRRLGLKKLPALVFLPGVEKAEKYSFLARFMLPRPDGHRQLLIPAKWDPKAEICDNKKDDTGNGKVDCDDPTCHEKLLCRKEKKRVIHAFVMSQCPYGLMAVLAMREVLDTFKDRVTFDLHFIADRKADGTFESLHGAPEVAEDIRQLCAKKHYLKKNRYLDYVWCRSKDANSTDWKICAKGAIKAKVIDTCATGPEGAKLLAEDIKLSKALGFSASPTLLANNVHKFHAISAEDIKKGICKVNKGLKGCKKTLSTTSTPKGACSK